MLPDWRPPSTARATARTACLPLSLSSSSALRPASDAPNGRSARTPSRSNSFSPSATSSSDRDGGASRTAATATRAAGRAGDGSVSRARARATSSSETAEGGSRGGSAGTPRVVRDGGAITARDMVGARRRESAASLETRCESGERTRSEGRTEEEPSVGGRGNIKASDSEPRSCPACGAPKLADGERAEPLVVGWDRRIPSGPASPSRGARCAEAVRSSEASRRDACRDERCGVDEAPA
mmetsp:Transcript_22568/g.53475  ORF Transcript_22568/g.53475 Transcript_22568/m.53475 type:complete len:240 (+) Transcript_22568:2060-2779(+)